MDLQLQNKRALVTGASRGLGYATARGLAREGCKVAINSRDIDHLREVAQNLSVETGIEVLPVHGNVAQPGINELVINKTVEGFGGLDILVTNAGGPPAGKFESFDDDTWQKAVELSLLSHMRLIRSALPHLRKSNAASVLTITSYSVKQPIPNLVLSNSIRAATVGLTKSLALELGEEGIRFNSILPAWTMTERVIELMEHRAEINNSTVQEEIEKQAGESSFGRMAQPEEFANAAVFLLSPVASYITGVMLPVDGGMIKGTF